MSPCVCGDPFHGGTCPHCGCSYYEPDDGEQQPEDSTYLLDRAIHHALTSGGAP